MYRDPLDELIEELERAVPPGPKPKFKSHVEEFMAMGAIIDAEPDVIEEPEEGIEPEEPPPAITTAPAVRLVPPARRLDPSAPTWDSASDADSDDSGG